MDKIIVEILIDLIAGLIGAAFLSALVHLARKVGPERGRRWANKLSRMGWPLLASVLFAISLIRAIVGGNWIAAAVLGVLLLLALASVILLRFGPERIRRLETGARVHGWKILTGVFFLTTVSLLFIDIICSIKPKWCPPCEQIVFVVDLADEEMVVFKDVLEGFERKLGAKVFLMSVNSNRHVARLDKMVASDAMRWDLIAVDNNILGLLVEKGLVEELSKYKKYDELIPQSVLPSLHPLLKFDGRWYLAPFRPNVKIAFYNEEKFAQYGLEPPKNWDQLLEVARAFKEKEGVGRVVIQGYPGKTAALTVFEFVKAAGGNPLTLDDDGSTRAFTFLQRLEPYLAREYAETRFDTANELLIDDEVYLVSNWPYGIKIVVGDLRKDEIKVYSGWKGPEREVHVLGGDVLAIPKGAPHPKLAVKLMELLLSKETQKTLFSRLCWPPVRLDAYDDKPSPPEMAPYLQAVKEALGSAVARPTSPRWTIVEDCLDRAFKGLIREGEDIASLIGYSFYLKMIPSHYVRYRVEPGDTLKGIADRHKTTPDILAKANQIPSTISIYKGQILLVPQK